jgi:hypothetical protein
LVASIRPAINRVPFPPKRISVSSETNATLIHERQIVLQKFLRHISSIVTANSLHPSTVRIQLAMQQFLSVEERIATIHLLEKTPSIPWRNVVQSFIFGVLQLKVMDKVLNGFVDSFMDHWEDEVDSVVWTVSKASELVENMRVFMDHLTAVLADGLTYDCLSILGEFLLRSPSPNKTLASLIRQSGDDIEAINDGNASPGLRSSTAVNDMKREEEHESKEAYDEPPLGRPSRTEILDGVVDDQTTKRAWERSDSDSDDDIEGRDEYSVSFISAPNPNGPEQSTSSASPGTGSTKEWELDTFSTNIGIDRSEDDGEAPPMPKHLSKLMYRNQDRLSSTQTGTPLTSKGSGAGRLTVDGSYLAGGPQKSTDGLDSVGCSAAAVSPSPAAAAADVFDDTVVPPFVNHSKVGASNSTTPVSSTINKASMVAIAEDEMRSIIRDAIRRQVEIEIYVACAIRLRSAVEMAYAHMERELARKIDLFRRKSQSFFGIAADHESPTNWGEIVEALSKLRIHTLPLDRLTCLTECCKLIPKLFSREHPYHKKPLGADEFLPVFIYVVVQAYIPNLLALHVELQNFCDKEKRMSEVGYYLATFEAAITHISEGNPLTGWPNLSSSNIMLYRNNSEDSHDSHKTMSSENSSLVMPVASDTSHAREGGLRTSVGREIAADDARSKSSSTTYKSRAHNSAVTVDPAHSILRSSMEDFDDYDNESDNHSEGGRDIKFRTDDALYERPSSLRPSVIGGLDAVNELQEWRSTAHENPLSATVEISHSSRKNGTIAHERPRNYQRGHHGVESDEEETKSFGSDDSDPADWQQWAADD